jgi:hypothetical protein
LQLKTNELTEQNISLVENAENDVFSYLVELSGLRPESDFKHARLAEVDFSGSELASFNFDYADLRRANWSGRVSDPKSFRLSLRGKGTADVRGADFDDIRALVFSKRNWGERLFAFRLLVDNWGENLDTFDVLVSVLENDPGTYLRLCSFVYFSASYANDEKMQNFCIGMANAGRSQLNIFKLGKLRRAVGNYSNYFESINIKERYPGDISMREVHLLALKLKPEYKLKEQLI